ncbi:hypothetical protein OFDDKENP_00233 [Aeromonas phage B614]|nr:hypothetical protein OFDDKENP_00233 [Aeromonas phage B614]UYD58290.1 hypothetical protein JNEOFJEA_00211 [Aeromonas phage UP87]UYD58404.1 hypothetical protein IPAKJDPM_00061 [Aeromonas phage avDM14-QBC]UYD58620.1 hypothetical protein HNNIDBEH_00027 [Aeromonas phage avDM10-HWA]UYD59077.1 hypothetical protein OFOPOMKI_00227 [Aeromonas phage avDM7-IJDJ]UYD59889.1 hypothetical protein LEHPIFIF_00116 [Aeromonas phage avDM9-HANS]
MMIVKVRFNFEEHVGEGVTAQEAFTAATKAMCDRLPANDSEHFYTTLPNNTLFGSDEIRAMKVVRMRKVLDGSVRADDFEFPFFVKVE